jgi:hypothetical protein
LFIWAFAPLFLSKVFNEWLVALVDDRVESCDSVFRDFSENNVIVGGTLTNVFWIVRVGGSNEVDTLSN